VEQKEEQKLENIEEIKNKEPININCDIEKTLESHNRFRLAHGVPELKWSEKCYI